jgi:hypothetical protein
VDVININQFFSSFINDSTFKRLESLVLYEPSSDVPLSLSTATTKQFNSIEYLIIHHECKFKGLSRIISYIPTLYRLDFSQIYKDDLNIEVLLPTTLANLTHLSIDDYRGNFDESIIFISKICSKLKMLSFTTYDEDIAYLNATRWEQFILNYLPQLETFYFRYYVYFINENICQMYLGRPAQFTSSFWTEQKWVFKVDVNYDYTAYSVHPYRYDKKKCLY